MAVLKRGPTGLSYYGRNNSTTLQEIKKTREWAKRMQGPSSDKVQLLNGVGKQREAHIRGQKTQTTSLQSTANA